MSKINNYVIFQGLMMKMPLLAKGTSRTWREKFGKLEICLSIEMEIYIASQIYYHDNAYAVAWYLRHSTNRNITPMQIDEFYEMFQEKHPLEPVETFDYADIPIYGSAKKGFELPLPGNSCVISMEHERELLDLIATSGNAGYEEVVDWFDDFMDEYAIEFKKLPNPTAELAQSFFFEHGLLLYPPPPPPDPDARKKEARGRLRGSYQHITSATPMVLLAIWMVPEGEMGSGVNIFSFCVAFFFALVASMWNQYDDHSEWKTSDLFAPLVQGLIMSVPTMIIYSILWLCLSFLFA